MSDQPIAILSDVHANLDALEAVLEDMQAFSPREIVCLGDVVGYGSEPRACWELLLQHNVRTVLGNHEVLTMLDYALSDLREDVAAGIALAREQLSDADLAMLREFPFTLNGGNEAYVHSSLHEPEAFFYVTDPARCRLHFARQKTRWCFIGHTHRPVVWVQGRRGGVRKVKSSESELSGGIEKFLVNVGSVGQPRDGDNRACYVLFHPETEYLEYRRVDYDVEAACSRMLKNGAHPVSVDRLRFGR